MEDHDYLILVDDTDKPWGRLEKQLVHEHGIMHRAFSVFIFNTVGDLLLQQRADTKYHSGGLWTNTCCSHPRFGEDTIDAVNRRLKEEMGMECGTHFAFSFTYRAELENGLVENEFDHVYIGVCDDKPSPDAAEVKSWKFDNILSIRNNLKNNPDQYTVWFNIVLDRVIEYMAIHEKTLKLNVLNKI